MQNDTVFGNQISKADIKNSIKEKNKLFKKFKPDPDCRLTLYQKKNQFLEPVFGLNELTFDKNENKPDFNKAILVGNIRMGYGHYRIAMAIASAANHFGYTPLWFDLLSFEGTRGSKIIGHLNNLYSLGSRLSQKYKLFNRYYWEPLNSTGFKSLAYNYKDRMMCELMTDIYMNIPKEVPYIGTHAWATLSALNAGMKTVVNVIPDNWPMGLHLAEGAIHTVQSNSAFLGYKVLREMDKKSEILNPIPAGKIVNTGHFIDHEIVSGIDKNCEARIDRINKNKTKNILMTIGGAGAQAQMYLDIIKDQIKNIKNNRVNLWLNLGDHYSTLELFTSKLKEYKDMITVIDDSLVVKAFKQADNENSTDSLDNNILEKLFNLSETGKTARKGITIFINRDIFKAVYLTNILINHCDILVTKPSELAYYPVPKLFVKRIGGHEEWGAIRSSEIGDGTIECETNLRAIQMLNLMLDEPEILTSFNKNIINNNKIGIYNGAYNAVRLAITGNTLN